MALFDWYGNGLAKVLEAGKECFEGVRRITRDGLRDGERHRWEIRRCVVVGLQRQPPRRVRGYPHEAPRRSFSVIQAHHICIVRCMYACFETFYQISGCCSLSATQDCLVAVTLALQPASILPTRGRYGRDASPLNNATHPFVPSVFCPLPYPRGLCTASKHHSVYGIISQVIISRRQHPQPIDVLVPCVLDDPRLPSIY